MSAGGSQTETAVCYNGIKTTKTLDRVCFTSDANRMPLRPDPRSISPGINLCEFRSKKTDQRRIIDPEQENYEGTSRAERTRCRGPPKVKPNEVLSSGKQDCCHRRSDPYVLPCGPHVGQKFVNHRKKNSDHEKRGDYIC